MALFSKLLQKIRGGSTSAGDWQEFEEALIASDLGAKSSAEIIELAKKSKSDEIVTAITNALSAWLSNGNRNLPSNSDRPTTILIVGVNGTGKTTSTAKLISFLKQNKHSVLVAAADTFRAAAVEQLATWGSRLEVEVVTGPANGDPASVAFEAATMAKAANIDYLIIDTAGRLHTKSGLMMNLERFNELLKKSYRSMKFYWL